MYLINCEITLQLTCSKKKIIADGNQVPKFKTCTCTLTGTKPYVSVVTLSTQKNIKLLKQLESGFRRTLNWNKYHSKKSSWAQCRYLNVLNDPSFQGVNRLFVLLFEGDDCRKSYMEYYLPTVKIKDYNVAIDGRNSFNGPIKNDIITYDNTRKIATGQGDECITGCLLDYRHFKNLL